MNYKIKKTKDQIRQLQDERDGKTNDFLLLPSYTVTITHLEI